MPEETSGGSCRSPAPRRARGAARRRLGRAALGLLGALAASAPAVAVRAQPTPAVPAQPTPAAPAQPAPAVRADADLLRRQAQELMASGRPEAACPKLEESDRLVPSAETKLALARCQESTGRLASAWALYTDVAAGGDAQRGAEARARAAAVAGKLPALTIAVSGEVKALPGLVVTIDGEAARRLGEPQPVAPGRRKIAATAPGRRTFTREVEVSRPGEQVEVEIAALAPAEATSEDTLEPAPLSGSVRRRWPTPSRSRPDPIHRNLMWVTGGLTLAGVALGTTFGVLAITTWDQVEDASAGCDNPARYRGCPQRVHDLSSRAMSYATVSDFSFIAAGAALAGTAVLWMTLPESESAPRASARVEIAPGVLGGSVLGVF
ncbi:uncharacterized protein SOCE26_059940 [Sorangium cellulosum]|uniref:PEGA domain-containing protein n=1 Tax=Sorangium cellulosum TaxID=56 RepID=A0A2L0EZ20_SORCE|nr:hypothetical protein [Sorangium cellulosum]AUX44530.1 uncharacterized protein SOCE26_059940 [Sorangium cellulosum]